MAGRGDAGTGRAGAPRGDAPIAARRHTNGTAPHPDDDLVDGIVDAVVSGRPMPDEDATAMYALAASLVRSLRDEPLPSSTQTLQLAAIRAHLERRTATLPVVSPRRPPLRARLGRRVAVAAASVTTVFSLAGGGAVAVAQEATPGDPLYGLKRASERVALAIEQDPAGRSDLQLAFAQRRLEEAAADPQHADALLAEAAVAVEQAAEHAGQEAVARLSALVDDQVTADHPGDARFAIARACVRIAERHGHVGAEADLCREVAEAAPEHPGRGRGAEGAGGPPSEAPGRSGEAPGRQGDAGTAGTVERGRGDSGDG